MQTSEIEVVKNFDLVEGAAQLADAIALIEIFNGWFDDLTNASDTLVKKDELEISKYGCAYAQYRALGVAMEKLYALSDALSDAEERKAVLFK